MTSTRLLPALPALLVPLALTLTACGDDDSDDGPAAVVTVTATPSPSTVASSAPGEGLPSAASTPSATGNGALELAAATASAADAGTLFSIDREDDGSWEVHLVGATGVETEVVVSADGGAVTRGPDTSDDDQDDRDENVRLLDAAVDWSAAITAARSAVPGAEVTGVSLDEEDGRARWEVSFATGSGDDDTTVDVDASSGAVLGTDRD